MGRKSLPQVEVIACNAVHDEMCARNRSLNYCSRNAICSHTNTIVERAIVRGVKTGKIAVEAALAMREVHRETQLELARWADMLSTCRRHRKDRKLSKDDLHRIDMLLLRCLGHDESKWDDVQAEGQLAIAKPMIETVQYLGDLGLFEFDAEPKRIDTRAIVQAGSLKV